MEDKFRSILIWSNHTWHAFDIVSADVAPQCSLMEIQCDYVPVDDAVLETKSYSMGYL